MRTCVLLATTRSVPGGAQKALASLASGLGSLGWEVEVALREPGWLADELARREIARVVADEVHVDPDRHAVVVSLGASGHAWAAPVAAAVGVPACWWLELGLRGRPNEDEAFALGAAAIAVPASGHVAEVEARAGGAPVVVISPGVELGAVVAHAEAGAALRSELAPGERLLVLVGRIDPIKGQDVALEALALLRAGGRPVRLAIVGDAILGTEGPLVAELRQLAAQLGVADHVRWVGHVDDPGPWFAAADVAIHASLHEAFGLTVVEALGHGVSVVATRTIGPTEILGDGEHGLLVAPGDPTALAEAIATVLDDDALARRLREGGPDRAEAFGPRATASAWTRLLRQVAPGLGPVRA